MNAQQAKQKLHHDRSRVKMRDFAASDSVSVRNMQGTYAKWIPGTVIRRLGPLTYLVRVGHRLRFVHIDHMLQAHSVDNTGGVEPTLDEPATVSQGAAREQKSVSPQHRLSRACLPQHRLSRACLPQHRLSRACLTRNRQRTHRCGVNVNVDMLTEFEKRRSDSMCEGVNRA